jgi:dehydrogenase/reductase SDR family protein 1
MQLTTAPGGLLRGKIALVTGASRGVGRGIALGLGEAGATVYVTGRSTRTRPSGVPLSGTIDDTADEVTALGGIGIPLQCDHRDDEQTRAVIERIKSDHGRLDILANSAWAGYDLYHAGKGETYQKPFWQQPAGVWDDMLSTGVRSQFITSHAAAQLLIAAKGLIVNVSFFAGLRHRSGENVAYSVAKVASDRMAEAMADHLRPNDVTVVSIYPGLVRTEGIMKWAQFMDLSNSESPQFVGRAVAALAADPKRLEKSGRILVAAELAEEYGFTDIDGKRPRSIRAEFEG